MKRIFASIFIFSVIGLISVIRAQGVEDALRYSFSDIGGTARYVSMGGSMGALGGDVSMLTDNPGGIGVFRTSMFVITPTLSSASIESNYYGVVSTENRLHFNFNNFGYVQTFDFERDRGLCTFSFALSYNRINDFYTNQFITGTNPNNSMADYFAYTANGNAPNNSPEELYPFAEGLAFQGYVIDTLNSVYHSAFADASGYSPNMKQTRTLQTDGRINEWNLTLGGNISNKVFIGFNIGIDDISYYESWGHYEDTTNSQQGSVLSHFGYSNELNVDGFGFNFKGGIIYKPIDFLRIGAAIHSPTWYTISESYINYIYSDSTPAYGYDPIYYDNNNQRWFATGYGVNDWALNTPMKILGSLGFQFGKYGLLNFDYEYADYSWIKTKDKNNSSSGAAYFRDLNSSIDNSFQSCHTLKAGGEVKLGIVSLRQGFAYYTNPWTDQTFHSNFQQYLYSGGIGVRLQRFSVDFAYSWMHREDSYVLYNYPNETTFVPAVAETKYNNFRYMLTLGMKL